MLASIRFLLVIAAASLLAIAGARAETETRFSQIDLIAEQLTLPAEGGVVTLGFYLEPKEGFHAFWTNPADARKAPSIDWELPEGFEAGPLRFPAPKYIPIGDLVTYGYEGAVIFLTDVTVPAGLSAGASFELNGKARWEVCREDLCSPDRGTLSLAMQVGDGATDSSVAQSFSEARTSLPEAVDWPANYEVKEGGSESEATVKFVVNSATLPDDVQSPYLFVAARDLVFYGTQETSQTGKALSFVMAAVPEATAVDETIAVLSYHDQDRGRVHVELKASRTDVVAAADAVSSAASVISGGGISFGQAALFAFIGGLILNLMPCVFPVLTIKALSLVKLGKANRGAAIESGFIYTLGILIAFAAIAAIMLAFRYAGAAVGWGFHLQNPIIVTSLALLMVAIGVNLLGAFEIGTSVTGVGQDLATGGERRASFFTGLLAVVVATPCMAPFMAGALGYALTQPAVISIAVFLSLGFGLAFPYLALCLVPGLGRILPKPGPWMVTFKSVLSFPMFVTALWLFWILGRQLGATSMFVGLLAATALAFGLWAFGKGAIGRFKFVWYALALAGLATAGYAVYQVESYKSAPIVSGEGSAGTLGGLALEHFDPALVQQYIAEGQPTFVYFTADWCISCKANERVALSTDKVADAFNARGIKVVEGDWTSGNQDITDWLEMYGRAGIPLYLYFPQGSSLETPAILPQILTPEIVIDAIDAADNQAGGG